MPPWTVLADLLGIDRRTIYRPRQRPADQGLVQAIRLQLGLRRQKRILPATAIPRAALSSG